MKKYIFLHFSGWQQTLLHLSSLLVHTAWLAVGGVTKENYGHCYGSHTVEIMFKNTYMAAPESPYHHLFNAIVR